MIQISKSTSTDIEQIASKHWEFLEPQLNKRIGDALEQRTYIELASSLHNEVKEMLEWFGENLSEIVMGKPSVLNKMNKDFETDNPVIFNVLKQEQILKVKPVTNYILKIFDYKKFCDHEMKPYYTQEVEKLKNIIDITKKQKMRNGIKQENIIPFFIEIKINIIDKINSSFVNESDGFALESISSLLERIGNLPVSLDEKPLKIDDVRKSIKTEINKSIKQFDEKNEITLLNFGKYREKYRTDWGPYQLIMELGLNVCPYCNRQYISTYYSQKGRTRGDLDHFFPKTLYPFLSLSFYNLIPSCKVCNSSLKGSKEFEYGKYIHPYEEGFEDKVIFTYNIEEVESFTDQDKINIELDRNKKIDVSEDFWKNAERNKEIFKLVPLYNMHKDIVANMIRIRQSHSDDAIESLMKQHPELFGSEQEVIEMLLFSHLDLKQYDKKILSKLVRDIAVELKFIERNSVNS